MTRVLKLGGSLVTDKDRVEVIDRTSLAAACRAIAAADPGDFVLVHGGGGFGHPAASAHGITTEAGTRDRAAIRSVTAAMDRLNDGIVEALAGAGVPAVGLAPRGCARKGPEGQLHISTGAVEAWREEGQLPVLFGDLVAHQGRGATVVSGDTLAVALGDTIGADRLGFCTDVPGVLDAEGAVIPAIRAPADVPDFGGATGTDVSGGMGGKVTKLLEAGVPSSIFGLGELDAFLAGGTPGTTIEP